MKITSVVPRAPREYTMSFPHGEGWAVVAALRLYADQHPDAALAADWREWAAMLDKELRRDA